MSKMHSGDVLEEGWVVVSHTKLRLISVRPFLMLLISCSDFSSSSLYIEVSNLMLPNQTSLKYSAKSPLEYVELCKISSPSQKCIT